MNTDTHRFYIRQRLNWTKMNADSTYNSHLTPYILRLLLGHG
jgi:hypothetical protein